MRLALLVLAALLAGCASEAPAPPDPGADVRTDEADLRPIEKDFAGTALATPATPATHAFTLEVPTGAAGVNGTLRWSDPAARFTLALVDPHGEVVDRGYPEREGSLVVATVEPPHSGTWTYLVNASLAANVPFRLHAVAELIVPRENVVRQTSELAAFEEVNVIMEKDASFTFAFNASAPVEWDVHSHPDNGYKRWQGGRDASRTGGFTAPERGIYSLLFENDQPLPVQLTFEMRGRFRLHSHAQ